MSSVPPFPDLPGPWHLEGEAYWMLLKPTTTLPPGAYAPLEQPKDDDPHDKSNEFLGGRGIVWIVRYTQTPVGPYNELIYIPGDFPTPSGGRAARVTRIYVSSPAPAYHGRRNWNIPKHLARFSFTPLGNSTLIEVFDLGGDGPQFQAPFFAAVATPQRFVPALPFSTRWLGAGAGALALPPLPAGPADKPEEVGTDEWKAGAFEMRGRVRLVWWEPAPTRAGSGIAPGDYGDGVGFPRIEARSFGVWWVPGMELDFGPTSPVEGTDAGSSGDRGLGGQ